jgi:hypothetical protein
MYRILSASKDAYITNKIINNAYRATDANIGQSGTLDLFKLYNESTLPNTSDIQTEISRILIKFNISEITSMSNSGKIDINSNTFKCFVQLHDVYGGQTTPEDFDIILFPLSKSFDEGSGYDISSFRDLGSCNFITASYKGGTVSAWNVPGAKGSGSLGDPNIDVIVSGSLSGPSGTSIYSLSPTQYFETGEENLFIDVTRIVSGTVSGQIPDHGFLIAYSGSYEQNDKTYFVKRFASRNSSNTNIRPKLIVKYDDSIQDNHEDFIFDVTGSLYLNNYHFGIPSNIISGESATELTGANALILKIQSGSFKKIFNVSQAKRGINLLTGIYSSSFAISSFSTASINSESIKKHIETSGSIKFNEVWSSADETITYLSSSLIISKNTRTAFNNFQQNLLVTVTNLKDSYKQGDFVKIKVFSEDRDRAISYTKIPIEKKSQIYHQMFYRVRDFQTGDILIDFDTIDGSTRLSTDSAGMYFEFYIDSLPRGRTYVFDFLIKKAGFDTIVTDAASIFRVE